MKLIGIILILLVAFIAVITYEESGRPEREREQAAAVERNRSKRLAAEGRGYDTETNFDPREFREDGTRLDGAVPPTQARNATPAPKPGDWMRQASSPLEKRAR